MSYPELDLAGKSMAVFGFGVEGIELVRYGVNQGAFVTVSDSRPAEQLTGRDRGHRRTARTAAARGHPHPR